MNLLRYLEELFNYDPQNPMIFNSGVFLVLFAFFITIYALIHKKKLAVTLYVIAFSFLFYYKSSGWYLWILVFTTFTDYSFAILITRAKQLIWKRLWLFLSVGVSLGILAYFKYTNFFIENWDTIVGNNFQPLDIFLPIGISFYTFQSISYVLDVYWKKIKPTQSILDYAFYLSFFPQLVAGPIVKASLFLPQLKEKIKLKKEDVYAGLWMIMVGLFKKAIIADYISQYNDLVFADPMHYSGFENLMAILGYTLQIYMDFSGYSDMAIGLGKIMGFNLGVNFNFPYKAFNITDFWRRWHISLSSWLRDYLYIPLGGNRKGKVRMYVNLFITMLLGGLWHGASWKFVFWGAMHGVGLAVHKALSNMLDKIPDRHYVNFMSWSVTFIFVIFLWVFFRAADINTRVHTYNTIISVENRMETEITSKDNLATLSVNVFKKDSLIKTINESFDVDGQKTLFIDVRDEEGQKEIIVNERTKAFDVAWIMVRKVITDMDLSFVVPFAKARSTWLILFIIGFAMHFPPQKWNDYMLQTYVRSPYLVKLVVFIVLVQFAVQFKSEEVQPFIYFQF